MHHQTGRIGVFAIKVIGKLPCHFGRIGGERRKVSTWARQPQGLFEGCLILGVGNKASLAHTPQNVALSFSCALGIHHGIEARGRFGKPGQHGSFGNGEFGQGLAKVGLRCCTETVRSLTEEDLIDVQLEDLLFGKRFFDFERQKNFDDLAAVSAFGRQKKFSRELHGDGAGPLLGASGHHVDHRGPGNADEVDADMVEKAGIFSSHQGVFHDLGYLMDGHKGSPLFAELANQNAVSAQNAQRNARLIGDEAVKRGQPVVDEQHRQSQREHHRGRGHEGRGQRDERELAPARTAPGTLGTTARRAVRGDLGAAHVRTANAAL